MLDESQKYLSMFLNKMFNIKLTMPKFLHAAAYTCKLLNFGIKGHRQCETVLSYSYWMKTQPCWNPNGVYRQRSPSCTEVASFQSCLWMDEVIPECVEQLNQLPLQRNTSIVIKLNYKPIANNLEWF